MKKEVLFGGEDLKTYDIICVEVPLITAAWMAIILY
jgi:hypothetical protein